RYLDYVFTSESARGSHNRKQHLIHCLPFAYDMSVLNRVGLGGGGLDRSLTRRDKALVGCRQGLWTGTADHRQPTPAQRRGDCSYGVIATNHSCCFVLRQVLDCGSPLVRLPFLQGKRVASTA